MKSILGNARELVRPYYLRFLYFPVFRSRPKNFSDAWTFQTNELKDDTLKSRVATTGVAPSFLFLPMSDWHARLQRTQHLARALARRGHRCYVLNPHLGREYPSIYLMDRFPRLGALEDRITELHVRLYREPVYHLRLLRSDESETLANTLGRLAVAEPSIVQVVSFPTWGEAAWRLQDRFGWPIVYDCHDYLAGFANVAPEIIDREPDLIRTANHVFFSSASLKDRFGGLTERWTQLPNGVQSTWCNRLAATCPPRKGVVGYFGALQEWFDVEAVRDAAQRNPQLEFWLVGRIETSKMDPLKDIPNIRLLGEVPHSRLPDLLENFDAGIIPFCLNELTIATNPIKVYEYFSAGIPVVSAPLTEVQQFGRLVYIAKPGEWPAQVAKAIAEQDEGLREERRKIARNATWDIRAEEMLNSLQTILMPARQHRAN